MTQSLTQLLTDPDFIREQGHRLPYELHSTHAAYPSLLRNPKHEPSMFMTKFGDFMCTTPYDKFPLWPPLNIPDPTEPTICVSVTDEDDLEDEETQRLQRDCDRLRRHLRMDDLLKLYHGNRQLVKSLMNIKHPEHCP